MKEKLYILLIEKIKSEISQLEKIYDSAVIAVQKADGRMQSRYDTQRFDYAQEAEHTKELIELKKHQLDYFQRARIEVTRKAAIPETVSIGTLVETMLNGEKQRFLIAPSGGGIEVPEHNCVVISDKAPIAEKLKGKHIGSKVRLPIGEAEIIGLY